MAVKNVYLTSGGARVSNYAMNNNIAVNFTKFGVGSGENYNPKEATEMTQEVFQIPITLTQRKGSNFYKVRGTLKNDNLKADVYYREIGLYVTDPENPDEEVLYCYGNAKGDDFDYTEIIPAFTTTGNVVTRIFDIDVYVQGGEATYFIDDTAKVDIATVQDLRNDLEQEITDRQSAIIDIEHGGTGGTTAKEAQFNLLKNMEEVDTNAIDDTFFLGSFVGASKTNGMVYKRKGLTVWEWIKSKISSVLGLTATQYNGNSSTATTLKATKLAEGTDLNNVLITGEYYALDNKEYANAPCINFSMRVIQMMSAYKYQILYAYQTAKVYCRCYYFTGSKNEWTEWKELATTKGYVTEAMRATNDGNGNNIVSTYATKSEVTKVENDAWGLTKSKINTDLGLNETQYRGRAMRATSSVFCVCNTDSSTAQKEVGLSEHFSLENGCTVKVLFKNGNNAENPTLIINGTGVKSIKIYKNGVKTALSTMYGSASSGACKWGNNTLLELMYDGEDWVAIGNPAVYQQISNTTANTYEATLYIDGKKEMWGRKTVSLTKSGPVLYMWGNGTTGITTLPISLSSSSTGTISINIHNASWNSCASLTSDRFIPYVGGEITHSSSSVTMHWRVEGY